jgi:hypothetical protein
LAVVMPAEEFEVAIPTPEVLWRKSPVRTDPRQPQGPTRIEERVGGAVENSDELAVGHAIGCPA